MGSIQFLQRKIICTAALLHNFSLHCFHQILLVSLTRNGICNLFSHIYFISFYFKQHNKIISISKCMSVRAYVCLYVRLYLHFHGKVFIHWTTQIKCFYNLQIPATNGTQDDLYFNSREQKQCLRHRVLKLEQPMFMGFLYISF